MILNGIKENHYEKCIVIIVVRKKYFISQYKPALPCVFINSVNINTTIDQKINAISTTVRVNIKFNIRSIIINVIRKLEVLS